MRTTNIGANPDLTVARELRAAMLGRVVLRGDADYVQTGQVWNVAVRHQPMVIAMCKSHYDVHAAIRSTREQRLCVSVRGGGHDWAGRSIRHGGLVNDLSHMRRVDVDPRASVATIQGGQQH